MDTIKIKNIWLAEESVQNMKREAAEDLQTTYLAKDLQRTSKLNNTMFHSQNYGLRGSADLFSRETIITDKVTPKKSLWKKHLFQKIY